MLMTGSVPSRLLVRVRERATHRCEKFSEWAGLRQITAGNQDQDR